MAGQDSIITMIQTIKDQAIETISQSKMPIIVASGAAATSFSGQDFAGWAAGMLSIMIAIKVGVDIWLRLKK